MSKYSFEIYFKKKCMRREGLKTKIGNSVFKEASYVCGEGFKEEAEEEGF